MINILIAGDFCPLHRVDKLIGQGKYDSIFSDVKELLTKMDYSLVNLEAPIVLDSATPIDKTGPNLKCNKQTTNAISYAGFNGITLANNHIGDYGDTGINDTLQCCKEAKLDTVGIGKNLSDAQTILYKEINGKKIDFINFCENEWTIALSHSSGANPLNIVANYYQIQESKRNADYVIVIIHGGSEYYQLPSPRMKETYRFFIDCGVNAVINHHQHCFSGYELYNNGLIFYGLGNFCFDDLHHRNSIWNEGYMVQLRLEQDNVSFELHPYKQCGATPTVQLLNENERNLFDEKIKKLKNDMPIETVKEIMGKPYSTSLVDGTLWMGYESRNRAARDYKGYTGSHVIITNGFVKEFFPFYRTGGF